MELQVNAPADQLDSTGVQDSTLGKLSININSSGKALVKSNSNSSKKNLSNSNIVAIMQKMPIAIAVLLISSAADT